MKKNLLAVAVSSAAFLFAASAYADGGPVAEPPPPPPPAPAPEPAPAYEPAPAPEYDWYTTIFAGIAFGHDLNADVNGQDVFGQTFSGSTNIPLNTGYLLGWTVGYDNLFDGDLIQLRPEMELSFRQRHVKLQGGINNAIGIFIPQQYLDQHSQPTDVLSLLGNLWVDFDLGGGLKPYAGGGVGVGWADMPWFIDNVTATDFVWQFGGGVNFDISSRVFLGVGYRYFGGDFGSGNIDLGGLFNVDHASYDYSYRTHEIMANLGVRF